jgi:nucleotide-binding universal stress UspA family protein
VRERVSLKAIDFSEQSRLAMREATRIAARDGAGLTLLHVGESPVIGADTEGAPSTIEEVEMQLRRDVEPAMATAKAEAEAEGISVETVVVFGKPPDEIVRRAEARGFDLVVVGTHGRTGFRRFVLGSVAEHVVRGAPCSVLVFRPLEALSGD